MTQINASIVLYHNKKEQVLRAIRSVLNTDLNVRLYLVDNSSNDVLKELAQLDSRITYIFNNANLGYGKAHNIAIRKSIEDHVPYHLVLNPDVYFERGVLEELYAYMEQNKDIGNIMPQVRYPDGEIQYLCKLLPTPIDLIFRRFMPFKKWLEKRNEKYESMDWV
jgi:GT2 family glycosyltransferase